MQRIEYTTTISIIMNGNTGRFPMPDNELLRGRRIVGMFVRKQDADSKAVDENGAVLVSEDGVRAVKVMFQVESIEKIARLPLEAFYQTDFRLYTDLDMNGFNPQKSFVEVDVSTDIADGEVVELNFIYLP